LSRILQKSWNLHASHCRCLPLRHPRRSCVRLPAPWFSLSAATVECGVLVVRGHAAVCESCERRLITPYITFDSWECRSNGGAECLLIYYGRWRITTASEFRYTELQFIYQALSVGLPSDLQQQQVKDILVPVPMIIINRCTLRCCCLCQAQKSSSL